MAKYDALISGSFALQFFERVTWPDSDLDIFVEQGEGCELFCKYLVEAEGYDLVRSQDQDRYAMYDLMEVSVMALARMGRKSNRNWCFRSEHIPK